MYMWVQPPRLLFFSFCLFVAMLIFHCHMSTVTMAQIFFKLNLVVQLSLTYFTSHLCSSVTTGRSSFLTGQNVVHSMENIVEKVKFWSHMSHEMSQENVTFFKHFYQHFQNSKHGIYLMEKSNQNIYNTGLFIEFLFNMAFNWIYHFFVVKIWLKLRKTYKNTCIFSKIQDIFWI